MNEIPIPEETFTPEMIKTESEHPPFQPYNHTLIAQHIFKLWVVANLGQEVVFVRNEEIEEKKAENPDTIFIPENLKLEEMPQVLDAIPGISEERKKELQEHLVDLGEMFVNSAVYIYEYMFQHDDPTTREAQEKQEQEEKKPNK